MNILNRMQNAMIRYDFDRFLIYVLYSHLRHHLLDFKHKKMKLIMEPLEFGIFATAIDLYLFFAGQAFGKSVCLKVSIIQLMIGISQKTL